jgi:S-adenosylmethionine decarboxylase
MSEPAPAVGSFSGRHVLAEMAEIDSVILDDEQFLREVLTTAATEAGATVLEVFSAHFLPQGVTVVALLSESHAAVHSYPELRSMFIDVFTCGQRADPEQAVRLMAKELGTSNVRMTVMQRNMQDIRPHTTPGVRVEEE